MEKTLRFGDRNAAAKYPLTVAVTQPWRAVDGKVEAIIAIPACPTQHILVPSLSIPGDARGFQFALRVEDSLWRLQPVASQTLLPERSVGSARTTAKATVPSAGHIRPGGVAVGTHIDCFHTESALPAGHLLVRLARPDPPEHFLITLSIRPLHIDPNIPVDTRAVLAAPPRISQMLGPAPIRRRICSPTALAMALKAAQPAIAWQSVVDACFDGKFYGSWPLAIRCAGLHGRLGAVEAVASWKPILKVLRSGSPVIASIRFGQGELPGAPLAETPGHLVAVYGVDDERVLVCDPAASDHSCVARSYDLTAFSNAWLRWRGAAYFLAPHRPAL